MKLIAICPDEFDPARHSLPLAGELLLPGAMAGIDADGRAFNVGGESESDARGTVIEMAKPGEAVELALNAERQADGGYFFTKLWVVEG